MANKLLLLSLVTLTSAVLMLAVEGLSSVLLLTALSGATAVAERVHTRHDAELGWVNLPNVHIEDMYGPGVWLATNAQGFRNTKEVLPAVPSGRARIVCSGDSMTLGYGVDNEHTWPYVLGEKSEELEVVNMGQGGYGIDQAYLWFMRDGGRMELDVHVFAFISHDFKRMEQSRFSGYAKPRLALDEAGVLQVENTPVPRQSWFARAALRAGELRTVELVRRLTKSRRSNAQQQSKRDARQKRLEPIVAAVFDSLDTWNRGHGSELVLLYLPGEHDYSDERARSWRDFVREHAAARGIHFVDLIPALREIPAHELQALFLQPGEVDYVGAAGHYTNAGNRFVADALYEALLHIPEVAARLR